jgi:hypothetical protein
MILEILASDAKVFISYNRLGLQVIPQCEPRWMQTLAFDPLPSNIISLRLKISYLLCRHIPL